MLDEFQFIYCGFVAVFHTCCEPMRSFGHVYKYYSMDIMHLSVCFFDLSHDLVF